MAENGVLLPDSISSFLLIAAIVALGGTAAASFTSVDDIPEGYAPPWDVFSPGQQPFFSFKYQTLTFGPDEEVKTQGIAVEPQYGEKNIIWRHFYIYLDGEWEKRSFPQQTIQDTNWIQHGASAAIDLRREAVQEGSNYALTYTCGLRNGQWKCGCRDENDCDNWQIQRYDVQKQESEDGNNSSATDGGGGTSGSGGGTGPALTLTDPSTGAAITDRPTTVSGEFAVWHSDNFEESRSVNDYKLRTDTGMYDVEFSGETPGLAIRGGSTVEITGIQRNNNTILTELKQKEAGATQTAGLHVSRSSNPNGDERNRYATAQLSPPIIDDDGGGNGGGGTGGGTSVETLRNVAVVLVNFANEELDRGREYYQQIFDGNTSIDSFLREVSYKKLGITGDIYGPLTLSMRNDGECRDELWRELLEGDIPGLDEDSYNHVVYIWPWPDNCGFSGKATYGDDNWMIIHEQEPFRYFAETFTHELGHNFGLRHTYGVDCRYAQTTDTWYDCKNIEYADYHDTMGRGANFNGIRRRQMQWMPQSNVEPVTEIGNQTHTIASLNRASTATNPALLVLDIPSSEDWYYYLEYGRMPEQFRSWEVWESDDEDRGVHIYQGVKNNPDNFLGTDWIPSLLFDTTPSSQSGDWDFHDAQLTVGETFEDDDADIGVKLVNLSATEAQVRLYHPSNKETGGGSGGGGGCPGQSNDPEQLQPC